MAPPSGIATAKANRDPLWHHQMMEPQPPPSQRIFVNREGQASEHQTAPHGHIVQLGRLRQRQHASRTFIRRFALALVLLIGAAVLYRFARG